MYIRTHYLPEEGRPRILDPEPNCQRGKLAEGSVVTCDRDGWTLKRGRKVTHRVVGKVAHRTLHRALGGRVFRVGQGPVHAVHEGELFIVPGLGGRTIFDLDDRVYLEPDGQREVIGLQEAVAEAVKGEPVPRERDERGIGPRNDSPEELERFAKAVADPAVRDEGLPGGSCHLAVAAAYGRAHLVKILLDAGADPNTSLDDQGRRPGWATLATDSTQTLDLLWDAGMRFEDPVRALMKAVMGGRPSVVQWCLDHDMRDARALHVAHAAPTNFKRTKEAHQQVIECLEGAGLVHDPGPAPSDPELAAVHAHMPMSHDWFYALLSLHARLDEPEVTACLRDALVHPGHGFARNHTWSQTNLVEMLFRHASPEVAFDLLSEDDELAELASIRGAAAETLDPRWLPRWLDLGMKSQLYERFDAEALAAHADRFLELGLSHRVDDAHPGKRALRLEQLERHYEPEDIAEAAALFADEPEMLPRVLTQTVETLDHVDDVQQARPHVHRLRAHVEALTDEHKVRLLEIAERWRAGTTGHVGHRHAKRIAKALEELGNDKYVPPA